MVHVAFGGGGPREIKYLFIDSGYFRKLVEKFGSEFFGTPDLPLDYSRLSQGYTKVFYYDCLPPRHKDEPDDDYQRRVEPDEKRFLQLGLQDRWHVIKGVIAGTGNRARQKQVDIQIAVDMLTHSYRRNMDRIAFLAGDQDFKPLVDAVVREGMFIQLWYEKTSASDELILAADARRPLDIYAVHAFLDPRFQNDHPLPQRSSQGKDTRGGTLVENGNGPYGLVELFKTPDGYLIIHDDIHNEAHYIHTYHHEPKLLKKVYEAVSGPVVWSDSK